MEIVCECTFGTEDIVKQEIKDLTGKTASAEEYGRVKLSASADEIILLNYCSQSIDRILIPLNLFEFKTLDELESKAEKTDYSSFYDGTQTFAFRCERKGAHDFNSVDAEAQLGASVINNFKNAKVDLSFPDFVFRAEITNKKCAIFLDTTGDHELHKRGYRAISTPQSLRPTVAYAMIKWAGWEKQKSFIDPFCGSGTIPIEAVLSAYKIPPGFFRKEKFGFLRINEFSSYKKIFEKCDSAIKKDAELDISALDMIMRNISISKKNSQMAGVLEAVKFLKYDIEWLDLKFEEKSTDCIITDPPMGFNPSGHSMDIKRVYNDFFYNSEFILKDSGRIAVVSLAQNILEKSFKDHKFEAVMTRDIGRAFKKPTLYILKKQ